MERDPVRLAWLHARPAHLLILLLALLSAPLWLVALDLPRQILDAMAAAPAGAPPFLRIVWDPPLWLWDGRWTFLSGWRLPLATQVQAAAGLLAGLMLTRALALLAAQLWRAAATERLVGGLERQIAAALIGARLLPLGAADSVRRALEAGPALRGFLAGALTDPLFAGGRILLVCLYLLWLDPVSGILGAVAALGLLLLARIEQDREARAATAGRRAGQERQGVLGDLSRVWAAARAHGMQRTERARAEAALIRIGRAPSRADRLARLPRLAFEALAHAAPLAGPLAMLGFALAGRLGPGAALSAALAFAALIAPARRLAAWRSAYGQARRDLRLVAEALAVLRGVADEPGTVPPGAFPGVIVAEGLVLGDPMGGPRLGPIDLALEAPVHAALVGSIRHDVETLAMGLAGLMPPLAGRVGVNGVDLEAMTPEVRAARVGYVSAEPVLLPGTWLDNLAYGAPAAPDLTDRVLAALPVAGLDTILRQAALASPVDPARHADLASALVGMRARIRANLARDGVEDLVDPFRPDAYNRHATIGENILFGQPVGDTFAPGHLASQPFLKAVLEAENLTQALVELGLAVARTSIELLDGIADDNPLVARLGFFAPAERGLYAEIVARQATRRRGAVRAADRDRLLAVALRYVESRHRLGLVDAALERRILGARRSFARLIPPSLRPALDPYDPGQVCRAASLADNLLFGRIAYDMAGAEARVAAAIRDALEMDGRDAQILTLGLATPLDLDDAYDHPDVPAAIDLVRVLLRTPDVVIIAADLGPRLPALSAALAGRTLLAACHDNRHIRALPFAFDLTTGRLGSSEEATR